MSIQDETLAEFKRIVHEAAINAKSREGLGLHLISTVSSDFDDYIAHAHLHKKPQSVSFVAFVKFFLLFPVSIYSTLFLGPSNKNPEIRNFIKSLYERKVVRHSQVRVINTYRMLHISDGVMKITAPTKMDHLQAKTQMIILILLFPFVVKFVWDVSVDLRAIPLGYITGTAFGFMFRDAYYRFWGRLRIFNFMTTRHPWLKPLGYQL